MKRSTTRDSPDPERFYALSFSMISALNALKSPLFLIDPSLNFALVG